MNAKERKRAVELFEAEQRAKARRRWVRRLAIERLRWVKVALSEMPADEKDQRLHEIEISQRQAKAKVWRATPAANRWVGTGAEKHQVHKDADRWAELGRVEAEAERLVVASRDRRHPPKPPVMEDPAAEHYGPFDIELDDLDWILEGNVHQNIQKLSVRQEQMTRPIVYRPDGSIASGPVVPQPPRAPSPPPSRPTPPPMPPLGLDAAEEYEIPFGKHKGETIGYLLGDRETIGYLQWLCTKADIQSPKFAEALQVVYDHYQGEIDSRTPPEETVVRYNPPPSPMLRPTEPPVNREPGWDDEDDIPF